jgi:flagellin-like hook-associated protein FlgL
MRNNLMALQSTASSLTQTQNRLSTGKKVNSALDNPTEFFAAQSHSQAASDLSSRLDGMSEGVQVVQSANTGISSITSLIQAAKGIASSALGSTDQASRTSYQSQFNSLRSQIDTLARTPALQPYPYRVLTPAPKA